MDLLYRFPDMSFDPFFDCPASLFQQCVAVNPVGWVLPFSLASARAFIYGTAQSVALAFEAGFVTASFDPSTSSGLRTDGFSLRSS